MRVVDASIAVVAIADDSTDGDVARAILTDVAPLAAPDLIDVECLSALRRHHLAGRLTTRRFQAALDDLAALPITRFPALPFVTAASRLVANLSAYDAMYVALAAALDAELVTADGRLARAPRLPCEVRLVGTSHGG